MNLEDKLSMWENDDDVVHFVEFERRDLGDAFAVLYHVTMASTVPTYGRHLAIRVVVRKRDNEVLDWDMANMNQGLRHELSWYKRGVEKYIKNKRESKNHY